MFKKILLFLFLFASNLHAATPIDIGILYNLTGPQSTLDLDAVKGAKLAAKQINAQGGLLGRPVQLTIVDGKSEPHDVSAAAKQLGENKNIVAVVGLSDTDMALAAIPVLAAHQKLFITSGATGVNLPGLAPGWVFLACFVDSQQAMTAAAFIRQKLQIKKIMLITQDDNDYAEMLSHFFQKNYTMQGGKIIKRLEFNHRELDLSAEFAPINKEGIDLIYLAAGPQMSIKMIKQLRAAGFTQPIMGGDSFDSDQLTASLGHLYFTTHAFINSANKDPKVQNFIKDFSAVYGEPPVSSFSGLAYDAVNLLALAIRSANSVNTDKIRVALLNTQKFVGVTGTIYYVDHFIPNKSVTVMEFDDGTRSLVPFVDPSRELASSRSLIPSPI